VTWAYSYREKVQGDHQLVDPKPGHNIKIETAFIKCLNILNSCNLPQPTICSCVDFVTLIFISRPATCMLHYCTKYK
jgi:hypothetical protein